MAKTCDKTKNVKMPALIMKYLYYKSIQMVNANMKIPFDDGTKDSDAALKAPRNRDGRSIFRLKRYDENGSLACYLTCKRFRKYFAR